jgi:acyl-CoA dehydrogenase
MLEPEGAVEAGPAARTAPRGRVPFKMLLARVHEIGAAVLAPHAAGVDQDARFPAESIDALRAERLLSAYVAPDAGGMGLSMSQVTRICEALGRYCASTAMIYAMHQIQVACIRHHGESSPFFRAFLREIADRQLLLASATSEAGIGGDIRTSRCAPVVDGERFTLEKEATVISYGHQSDAILVTCRRSPEAGPRDQLLVLVRREEMELEPRSGWDTLGFRGTCSLGFMLRGWGSTAQVLPEPFEDVFTRTMNPFSHLTWASLWLGLATDAAERARRAVLKTVRERAGISEITGIRMAELNETLFLMRGGLQGVVADYQALLDGGDPEAFRDYGFAIRLSNVKTTCSELVVDVVAKALRIVGIAGYRNDSPASLGRHLRDAYGAALMVNNDRIRTGNAALHIMQRQVAQE